MGEGVALVRRFGVDPRVFCRVLTEGLFAAPACERYGESSSTKPTTVLGSQR